MASIYDRKPTTFAPSDLVRPEVGARSGIAPPPTGGHPSASSGGGDSALGFGPSIPPDQLMEWYNRLTGLDAVYSLPAGGYLSSADASNANSYYNKFGGSDPRVNARVADFWGDLGELPTTGNLTPAAQSLAARTPGYQPTLGPSINQRLGHRWEGPWDIT